MIADRRERLASFAGVALLHLLLGWALLLSLAPALVRSVSEPLGVFNLREAPPPPPFEEPEVKQEPEPGPAPEEPAGESAAPPRQAPPVVAPKRVVERENPAVAAGLIPSSGGDSGGVSANASGTGGSGSGTGSGSATGTAGTGSGGGGTGGSGAAVVRPKLRSGAILPRDYPRAAAGAQGMVQTQLTVGASGAVTGCRVTRSSGNAVLDATTCRLIRERFRFTPARNAQGSPVPDVHGWQQRWWRD
jgi:protein TonB